MRPTGRFRTSCGGREAPGIAARRSNGAPTATRPMGPNAISDVKGNLFGKQQATCSNVGHSDAHAAEPSSPNSARIRSEIPACNSPNPLRSNACPHERCAISSPIAAHTHSKKSTSFTSPSTELICAARWSCCKWRLKRRNPCVSKG